MLFQTKLIQASESIRRPVAEVYTFYRDLRNLTRFLGDVITVEQMSEDLSPVDNSGVIRCQGKLDRSSYGGADEGTNPL